MYTQLTFPTLKLNLASSALSKGKYELFLALFSSLELVPPDTIQNRPKTLKIGVNPELFPPTWAPTPLRLENPNSTSVGWSRS